MELLELTLPQHSRLEKNAHAPILAILNTLDQIRTECASFTAANDNRAAIQKLQQALGEQIVTLVEVDDRDQESVRRGAAYATARGLYAGHVLGISNKVKYITSEEEGTKIHQRKMHAAFSALRLAVQSFAEDNDTRPAVIAELKKLRSEVENVMLLDLHLDPWYAKGLYGACESLLVTLQQPVPPPAAEYVERGERNAQRAKAHDAAYDFTTAVRSVGYSYFSPIEESAPIGVTADAIRIELASDFCSPIGDVGALAAQVRAILSSVQRLGNVFIPQGKGSPEILRGGIHAATKAGNELLAILEPQQQTSFSSAPSLLDRVRKFVPSVSNFGWAE